MNELLEKAIEAHGGIKRWKGAVAITVDLSIGGALFEGKGQAGVFGLVELEADLRNQRVLLRHLGKSDLTAIFTPQRVTLEASGGKQVGALIRPREALIALDEQALWELSHAAYFCGYAMWTYLSQPFLYSYPGVEVEEIEPWEEDGDLLRRLKVKFPDQITTHTREQISYFGKDGLLRRHDYAVDVLRGAEGANYSYEYRDCDGFKVPRRRIVYARGDDNRRVPDPILVSIDIGSVKFRFG
jgi:hypothetical protein